MQWDTRRLISSHVKIILVTYIIFTFQKIWARRNSLIRPGISTLGTPRHTKWIPVLRDCIIVEFEHTRTARHRTLNRKLGIIRFINSCIFVLITCLGRNALVAFGRSALNIATFITTTTLYRYTCHSSLRSIYAISWI